MKTQEAEKITEEFFKRRFPDKEIAFEKQCGYFGEWVDRFKTGQSEGYMDDISLKIWRKMKIKKCVLCGKDIIGYGSNAQPLVDGICCNECDFTKVIPERIRRYREQEEYLLEQSREKHFEEKEKEDGN